MAEEHIQLNDTQSIVPRAPEVIRTISAFLEKYPYLDLTGKVVVGQRIGFGGYSDVFGGTLVNQKIAIKSVRVFMDENTGFERAIVRELQVWRRQDHCNVQPLLGYANVNGLPSLISEWRENSTVSNYLKEYDINLIERFEIIKGIACGLSYLHENDIVHSDLKPENILIGDDKSPLLTDFGLSRILLESHTLTGTKDLKGSIRYMAIELLEFSDHLQTKKSDVWAFGMVAHEILTGHIPFSEILHEAAVMKSILDGSWPPQVDTIRGSDVFARFILESTWIPRPALRPCMRDVYFTMEQLLNWKLESDAKLFTPDCKNTNKYINNIIQNPHLHPVYPTASMIFNRVPQQACISDQGELFAVSFNDFAIQIFNFKSIQPKSKDLIGHTGALMKIMFSHKGHYLASVSYSEVIVWDCQDGSIFAGPFRIQSHYSSLWISDDDLYLKFMSSTDVIYTIDIQYKNIIKKESVSDYLDINSNISCYLFSSDGTSIYAQQKSDQAVYRHYSSTGQPLGQIIPPLGHMQTNTSFREQLRIDSHAEKAISSLRSGSQWYDEVWSINEIHTEYDTALLGPIPVHSYGYTVLSQDGRLAVLYDRIGYIYIYSLTTGRSLCRMFRAHSADYIYQTISSDGQYMISVASDKTLKIWCLQKLYNMMASFTEKNVKAKE